MKPLKDRNFDPFVEKFEQKVYGTPKGNWRLKLLKEDLDEFYRAAKPLSIWDAGCGFGQISQWLAGQGHRLTLCDVSEKMLARARQNLSEAGLIAEFHHEPAQTLAAKLPPFDLVLFHAVIEWLADPLPVLQIIMDKVKPGGYLSLLFYNRNAMVYTNALKGHWRWKNLLDDAYLGKGKKLTPPNPQYPHEVIERLQSHGFSITAHTGIRVFHDYVSKDTLDGSDPAELFELEYRYCRMPTYRDMGRYIHLLARRQSDND
ncbi:methyltransferase domain-containing protein [Methylotuvimicrobium sp. KM1]|uniref:methyltransferase domain-containing protein n=1 Tax=Methylotuvimicrobium sp. KM1 TaxID=3377707 RepID=UPI0038514DEE